jgi:probable O-glycosylation ligase (exosortase A-associated)
MAVMLWWKSRQKFFLALVLGLTALGIYGFMPEQWFERMSTIRTYEDELSAKSRFDSWEFAYNLALNRFLGGGFETFRGRSDAHSIYFEVMGEHGFVGFGLFLMLWLFTWMAAGRIRRIGERTADMAWMGTLARMTQVSLVAYLSAGTFLGMAYFDYPYNLVLFVGVCMAILASRAAGAVSASAVGSPPSARRPALQVAPASPPRSVGRRTTSAQLGSEARRP